MKLPDYGYYRAIFDGCSMPFAFVDLDLLNKNIEAILKRSGSKMIRLASKSIRCRYILDHILKAHQQFNGIMCFSVSEAVWLSQNGIDDLLVGYPSWNIDDLTAVAGELKSGKRITLMADLPEHLHRINKVGEKEKVIFPVCLDMDMSTTFPGIWFGVKRSSVRTIEDVEYFLKKIRECQFVQLKGFMGYEAQIAGIADAVPGQMVMNSILTLLKKRSNKRIAVKRQQAVNLIRETGIQLDFVNGGGTGSLETTSKEPHVTEVTVGSGFYSSHLFDNYLQFSHLPATAYAIEIVRQPEKNIFTCLGGGYVASGATGDDKAPKPYLPKGITLLKHEMAGEVQTPVKYSGKDQLDLGDPVFFRHSKAGELCEHFNEIHIVSSGKIIKTVPTYRGEGQVFL